MSKFLYPIYKLKTKSYIKWWLYHKKAGGSGVLSQILEGFSFNLENTLNRKFKLFEIEGNSVQDGTPSPDNEVPILSSGDNENLFDIDSVTSVIRGQIPDENKVIYTNENTSGNFNVIPNFSALELKSTTYFISMDIRRETGSLIFGKINDGNSDWTLVKAPSLSNNYNRYIYKKTYSENTSINRMLIQFVGEGSASIKNIKLEQGNKASGYSPYGMGSINEKIKNADGTEEQDYSIYTQQPMRSIGDVRDCFVKKSDGWYERHYIAEVILDGSRVWNKSSGYSNEEYFCGFLAVGISNTIDGSFALNDSFQIGLYTTILDEECMSNNYQFNVRILASRLSENSVEGFKQWLSTHNVKAYGRYVTPLDLPCTQAQIDVLENMPSTYKDFTIIQSQDETPAYLKIQYYKEG